MTKLTAICGAPCSRVLTRPAWADFTAGKRAYAKGDYATALKEWRPLADQRDARSQFLPGSMYYFGQDVAQYYEEATKWFRKAADQGEADAQFLLGIICANGRGVPENYAGELRWYRKAADQGLADTQFSLGVSYGLGKGVPQDYAEAHMWFNLAASRASGDDQKKYAEFRDAVAKKMTAEQIAEAQRRAQEWKPKSGEKWGGRPMK